MGTSILLGILFTWLCWLAIGVLGGQLFVHYIEHKLNKIKYSYLRYVVTMVSIFFLIWVLVKAGGFEKKEHWVLSLLPIVFMIASMLLTVKFLFKKKAIEIL